MFPLSAEKLPLLEIADFWSREIKPPASHKELLALLESAWWQGQLKGNSALNRLQFLKKMFESRHEPHMHSVVFVTPNDAGPTTETWLAEGGVVVDVRPRIRVPGETDDWTESSCSGAFETLASSPSHEHFPELSMGLCFIDLTFEEFFGWVQTRGFETPKFWKQGNEKDAPRIMEKAIAVKRIIPQQSENGLTGTGKVGKVIQNIFHKRFAKGLPIGMSSAERNEIVQDEAAKILGFKPHIRTIQRTIAKITQ
jgi:hypothetical protein